MADFLKSYAITGLTAYVDNRMTQQAFHALLNDLCPGSKLDRDVVFNPSPDLPEGFLVSTLGTHSVFAVAKIAKSYNFPLKRLQVTLSVLPQGRDAVDNARWLRAAFWEDSLRATKAWFTKNKPRVNADPLSDTDPKYLGPMAWDFGSRSSDSKLRMDADLNYTWYVRKEYAMAAWSFIQLDQEGGLEGIGRAFDAITNTLASPVAFGFALPGEDKLKLPKKEEAPNHNNFEKWLLTTVAHKAALHIFPMSAGERGDYITSILDRFKVEIIQGITVMLENERDAKIAALRAKGAEARANNK